MKKEKKKGTGKAGTVAVVAVSAVTIAANVAANMFSQSLDTYLGRGQKIVESTGLTAEDAVYYDKKYEDTNAETGSVAQGLELSRKITDEGEVLMKNNGVLPLAEGSKVTIFGYRYESPVYGGTGSGNVDSSKDYIATPQKSLSNVYEINTEVTEAMEQATPIELTSDGMAKASASDSGKGFSGASTSILEYDASIYDGHESSCQGTTGIVFLGRVGGEGGNLQQTAYADGTPHELALTENEKAMLAFAKKNCDKVVVIVNTSNVMEIGDLAGDDSDISADAILWIGGPGATGFDSMADILTGKVNPSGRLADIWDADLTKNPTYVNFGEDRTYTNTKDTVIASNYTGLYYEELEEGIYYGYRYYETASDLGYLDYDESVVYPFGYGLSYTTFEQSIQNVAVDDTEITVTVDVTNTGSLDGKEVVQLYSNPPYTDLDQENHIEKSTKNLVAFDKVEVPAGETKEVTLTFDQEDLASYAYMHDNGDGTQGCWFLESGDYSLILGKDSHDAWDSETYTVDSDIWYTNDNPRKSEINAQSALDDAGNSTGTPAAAAADSSATFIAATNEFSDVTAYVEEQMNPLTRADWENTQPTRPEDKELSEERLAEASDFDPENDELLGDHEGSAVYSTDLPTEKADNGLSLSDMRGLPFYDSQWDLLLDQLDYDSDQMTTLLYLSAFTTGPLDSIGKPASVDHDGPQGWGMTGAEGGPETCAYATEVVVASTFNTELAYGYGEAIGQEALTVGYTGWYGPGVNIHRTAFNGRNFEYYSEDPLLSGKIAAACVSGAADQGVICYMKHFAMNEYEGPSCSMMAWADEQTIREIYLKAFEIPVKEARMTIKYISDEEGTMSEKTMRATSALMMAANMIGDRWCTANYPLIHNVVRGEWGYEGDISSDMFLQCSPNIETKAFRAGTAVKMWYVPSDNPMDLNNATNRTVVRNNLKYLLYAYVNSNLMNGVAPGSRTHYAMSPWRIGLYLFDAAWAAFVVIFVIRKVRKHHKS